MSVKLKSIFECNKCGAQYPKWTGRCLECGAWSSLSEVVQDLKEEKIKNVISKLKSLDIVDLDKVSDANTERFKSSITELDRVLGGGLIRGSLVLLSGEPGAGKSTLLAQACNAIALKNPSMSNILYISGEESASQVKLRLERLKCDLKKFKFIGETNLEQIIASVMNNKPDLLVVDSIQTIYSSLLPGEAGGISQIRSVAVKFMELAKKFDIPVFLIGHITKDGQIAGPKSLEHIVDVVLNLENDNRGAYSILRSTKNRFGSVNEIGILEMTSDGFHEVSNPSSIFLDNDLGSSFSGSVFSCIIEGNRPFLINIQSLLSKTVFGYPQRKSSGFDLNRLQVLAAVITKKQKIDLNNQDILLNIVGGLKTSDPGLDLPVSLSIISSYFDKSLDNKMAAVGELGLGGEIRPVSYLSIRLNELEKMGFEKVVLSGLLNQKEKERIISSFKTLELIFVDNLKDLIKQLFAK